MGIARDHARLAKGLGRRPPGPRQTGCQRVLRRYYFRLGDKRGNGIGKTRSSKGIKIMAIVDRHGLPVAVCTESAQRAEVLGPAAVRLHVHRSDAAAPIQAPLGERTVLRLATQLPASGKPLGTQSPELPSTRGTRRRCNPPQCPFEIFSRYLWKPLEIHYMTTCGVSSSK